MNDHCRCDPFPWLQVLSPELSATSWTWKLHNLKTSSLSLKQRQMVVFSAFLLYELFTSWNHVKLYMFEMCLLTCKPSFGQPACKSLKQLFLSKMKKLSSRDTKCQFADLDPANQLKWSLIFVAKPSLLAADRSFDVQNVQVKSHFSCAFSEISSTSKWALTSQKVGLWWNFLQ